jgi:hypothetical protein
LTWELLFPIPRVAPDAGKEAMKRDMARRRNEIKKRLEMRQCLGDTALEHIHEIGYDLPEECLLALTDEVPYLLSLLYPLYIQVDDYFANPHLHVDMVRAYSHYKETLQILSAQVAEQEKSKRWVLKCPAHLFHTKEIMEVFPDAKIIWTHRHPVSAIPSMCSLLKSIHQVYYEHDCGDDTLVGQAVKRCYEDRLDQIADDIQSYGNAAVNVNYERLIKDPISVVKAIYAQFKWTFTVEYEERLQTFLVQDRKKREAIKLKRLSPAWMKSHTVIHTYSPQEFGLTVDELSQGQFALYASRFKVPFSKS